MPIKFNPEVIAKGGGTGLIKTIVGAAVVPDSVTDDKIGNSYLGTPVIDNLEFPQGSYVDLDGNQIDYGAVVVDTVVFTVNKVRNVIKTSVQGRNGTIKEYVSDGDYSISCQGVISNRDNVFPEEQARALRQVLEVPQQLPVISIFLNNTHEIFDIVIESWSMPFEAGKRNEMPFSFIAVSDTPLGVDELEPVS
jgi:hypothetical protein